jgi:hypothetical protein
MLPLLKTKLLYYPRKIKDYKHYYNNNPHLNNHLEEFLYLNTNYRCYQLKTKDSIPNFNKFKV